MLEGDYTATPFGGTSGDEPDWFKLTATGKNAGGETVGTLEFYLADYRFENNDDDYILNTWEWFDLSPLGTVASISFGLSSSKNNSGGMITPAYFCMDNFNGVGPETPDLPPYIANPVEDVVFNEFPQTIEINLDGVATDPDNDDEQIVYTIVSNSNEAELSAEINDKTLVLTRLSREEAVADIVLRATSNGLHVDFNIHVIINFIPDGIEENTFSMAVYPNPTNGELNLKIEGINHFNYLIYNMIGQNVMNGSVDGNEACLDLGRLEKGVYFVSVVSEHQKIVKKVVVK